MGLAEALLIGLSSALGVILGGLIHLYLILPRRFKTTITIEAQQFEMLGEREKEALVEHALKILDEERRRVIRRETLLTIVMALATFISISLYSYYLWYSG